MLQYLLEIGCEELPASFIPKAAEFLKTETTARLATMNLPFEKIFAGGTPRRLYLCIDNLAENQEHKTEIVIGPPAAIAFDDNGEVTEVGKKFATSKGLDLQTLKKIATPKGEYLQGEKKIGGGKAKDILQTLIPEVIKSIPFAKSMKWGDGDFRFARPVHYFLSILNKEELPFEVGGIKSGITTCGHRFLAPAPIKVTDFQVYKSALEKAFVIIDSEKRKSMIVDGLANIAKAKSVSITPETELLETVVNLTEYPHPIAGSFDEEFLQLPEEMLVTTMKINQKYFPVKDAKGKLINMFVGVANIVPLTSDELIRKGYERVLRARLKDAMFFFANDKKTPLENMADKLKNVVYQEKLGTVYEKILRMTKVAVYLSDKLIPDKTDSVKVTAMLAKADLMSEMVYEFPELQGVMGYYYAKIQNKPEGVCLGIKEHYLPKFAGDVLPDCAEGTIVSLADKFDTICGAFAIGMIPTGNLDPYGLRRATIGILNIIEFSGLRLNLSEVVDFCLANLAEKVSFNMAETRGLILNFIMQRLKQIIITKGDGDAEIFDAVIGKSFDTVAIYNLTKVISTAKGSDDFRIIADSFKRINNILKKNGWEKCGYSENLFETQEEKDIAHLIKNQHIADMIKAEKNYEALDELLKFAPAVASFFEKVMVMTEDKNIRENRLGLLFTLRETFLAVGNFEAISF